MNASEIIKSIEAEQLKAEVPQFNVGDTVKVYGKIKEGNRERIQYNTDCTDCKHFRQIFSFSLFTLHPVDASLRKTESQGLLQSFGCIIADLNLTVGSLTAL